MRSILATILFVLITLLLSILSIPAALVDRSGKLYLRLARFWSKCFLWLYGIRVEARGLENIHSGRPTVYIANHSSYADIPVILAAIPDNIRLILRDSLTRIPVWGWALKASPFLIVSRSNATKARETLTHAANVIHSGAAVLLFPEGTRTSDGVMQSFKRGAFKIALESGAVVVPIVIQGTFELLPRSKQLPKTNCHVVLKVGEPITAQGSGRVEEIELMKQAETAMKELMEEIS